MKRIQLALNLRGLDPSGTELYANSVYMALSNNSNFTGVANYLPALNTGIGDLHSALTAAQPSSLAIKNKLLYLVKVLSAIKGIVELECGDDEEKALSSGFDLRRNHGNRPKNFDAQQGSVSGTVDLVCPYAGSRAAYVWELTTDISVAADWKLFKITNTASAQASGLNPGVKYWFRVKAIVHNEEQPYSDPHLVHVV
jgi:hypothetical protein